MRWHNGTDVANFPSRPLMIFIVVVAGIIRVWDGFWGLFRKKRRHKV